MACLSAKASVDGSFVDERHLQGTTESIVMLTTIVANWINLDRNRNRAVKVQKNPHKADEC